MIRETIKKFSNQVIELNDFMADNPEIGGQEFKSSQKIVDLLEKNGFSVIYPFANLETSFKATINEGKNIKGALLVEYDALRGMGHACGHCASGSISILAGLILNELRENLDAQIDIIGTPDEEINGKKAVMVDTGIFDQYDFAIMIHMSNENIVYEKTLALDAFNFKFFGRPAHAAAEPWEGINALNAIRLTFDAIDMMRQHVRPDVRLHGFIEKGGEASNIVPEYASAEILTRALDRDYLDYVSSWVQDIGKAAALATKTTIEIEQLGEKFHDLSSKPTGNQVIEEIYKDLELEIVDASNRAGGSSDIGNVDYVCPAFHPYLSIGEDHGIHTQEFANAMKKEKTHDAILLGGEIISKFVFEITNNPHLLERIKEEHKKNRGL